MTVAKIVKKQAKGDAQQHLDISCLVITFVQALERMNWPIAEVFIEEVARRKLTLDWDTNPILLAQMTPHLIFMVVNHNLLLPSQLISYRCLKFELNYLVNRGRHNNGSLQHLDLAAYIILHTPMQELNKFVNIAEKKYLLLFVRNGSYFSVLKKGIDKLLRDTPKNKKGIKNKNAILAALFNVAITCENYAIASFLIQLSPIRNFKVSPYAYQKFLDYQSSAYREYESAYWEGIKNTELGTDISLIWDFYELSRKSPAYISLVRHLPPVFTNLIMEYADLYPDSPVDADNNPMVLKAPENSPQFSGSAVFHKLTSNQCTGTFYHLLQNFWNLLDPNNKRALKLISKEVKAILNEHPSLDDLDEIGMTKVIKELLKENGVLDVALKEMAEAYQRYQQIHQNHRPREFDQCLAPRAIFASLNKISRRTLCDYSLIFESDLTQNKNLKESRMWFLARFKRYLATLGDDSVCDFRRNSGVAEPVQNGPFWGRGSTFFSNVADTCAEERPPKKQKIDLPPLENQINPNVFFNWPIEECPSVTKELEIALGRTDWLPGAEQAFRRS